MGKIIINQLRKLTDTVKSAVARFRTTGRTDVDCVATANYVVTARINTINYPRIIKYAGLICAGLAIISINTLNIIAGLGGGSQIGYAATEAPMGGGISGLDTRNTDNAPYITLSIHNATSSCDTSTANSDGGSDVCLSIPPDGGVATGGHTVDVETNASEGYVVTLSSTTENTDLVNTNNSRQVIKTSNGTLSHPVSELADNRWAVAWPAKHSDGTVESGIGTSCSTSSSSGYCYAAMPSQSDEEASKVIYQSDSPTNGTPDHIDVNYAARIDDPTSTQAGDYRAEVVYTATAKLPPAPTITAVSPDNYKIGDTHQGSNLITITGTNLDTTYDVYIDLNGNGSRDDNEECTVASATNTTVTCTVPTGVDQAGNHHLYLTTQGGTVRLANGFNYYKLRDVCTDELCVTYDQNMIPIRYVGTSTNAKWVVVTDDQLADTGNWFNYNNKQWANAVTVKADRLNYYLQATRGSDTNVEVAEDDILGYWVYVPRFAYEVKRYNATDKYVAAENFDIHFEKATTTKKIPQASCNTNIKTAADMWVNGTANNVASNIKAKDYRTGCGISRTYGAATGTTWATHPAFTYGNEELNGFWMGKFEMTGKISEPTIKPNQFANVGNYIGEYWASIASIGVDDPDNTGGGSTRTSVTGTKHDGTVVKQNLSDTKQNSHSLTILTANLIKNDQWGAAAYLSASKYGAGVNNVRNNSAKLWDYTKADGGHTYYTDDDGDKVTTCQNSSGVTVDCYSSDAKTNYGGNHTGCGPAAAGDANSSASVAWYYDCQPNSKHSYQGELGVLASTTNNVYGIYDMAGADWEYVASNLTDRQGMTASSKLLSTSVFKNPASGRYVNLKEGASGYDITTPYNNGAPATDSSLHQPWTVAASETNFYVWQYNNDFCTWGDCGGEAMHETKSRQSVNAWAASWGSDYSAFSYASNTWLLRGGRVGDGTSAGVFASYYSYGWGYTYHTSRAVLAGR